MIIESSNYIEEKRISHFSLVGVQIYIGDSQQLAGPLSFFGG